VRKNLNKNIFTVILIKIIISNAEFQKYINTHLILSRLKLNMRWW